MNFTILFFLLKYMCSLQAKYVLHLKKLNMWLKFFFFWFRSSPKNVKRNYHEVFCGVCVGLGRSPRQTDPDTGWWRGYHGNTNVYTLHQRRWVCCCCCRISHIYYKIHPTEKEKQPEKLPKWESFRQVRPPVYPTTRRHLLLYLMAPWLQISTNLTFFKPVLVHFMAHHNAKNKNQI